MPDLEYRVEDVSCRECGCEHEEYEPFTPEMTECLRLCQQLYSLPQCSGGGPLHGLLDDGNTDGDISRYVDDDFIREVGRFGVKSACVNLARKIIALMEPMDGWQRDGIVDALHAALRKAAK